MDILLEVLFELIFAIIEYSLESAFDNNNAKKRLLTTYELKKQEHKFFLLVAVLLYVFYEDDENFSVQERMKVKRYIKMSSVVTHKKTRKDLKRMLKRKVTIEELKGIIKDYSLTQGEVKKTFKLIEDKMSRRDKELRYNSLLRNIQSTLIREF